VFKVIYSVVLTQSTSPISQFSRQCNEFTSVWLLFPDSFMVNSL